MTNLPTFYLRGTDRILHSYDGNFLLDVTRRNRLDGMYGLTGDMLNEALQEYGAVLGNEDLMFQDDRMSTFFILRWSR